MHSDATLATVSHIKCFSTALFSAVCKLSSTVYVAQADWGRPEGRQAAGCCIGSGRADKAAHSAHAQQGGGGRHGPPHHGGGLPPHQAHPA